MKAEVTIEPGNAVDAQPLYSRAAEQAKELVQRSGAAIREQAHKASDSTVSYIRAEPVKAVLIAAASGAALATVIGLLSRSRRD